MGTATLSGPSPPRGSGVPIRRVCDVGEEDAVDARKAEESGRDGGPNIGDSSIWGEDSTHCGMEDSLTAGGSHCSVGDGHLDLLGDEDSPHVLDGHSDGDSPNAWDGHSVEDGHHNGSHVQVYNSLYEEGLRIGLSIGAEDSDQAIVIIRRGIKQSDLWTFYKVDGLMGPANEKLQYWN